MAGVLRGLGDDVQQGLTGGPLLTWLVPGSLRQRVRDVQVKPSADQFIGLARSLRIASEDAVKGLARQHAELISSLLPVSLGHLGRVTQCRWPAENETDPARLNGRDMLDQAAEAQFAHRRALPGLLVAEIAGGEPQEIPPLGQRGQQVSVLAADRGTADRTGGRAIHAFRLSWVAYLVTRPR